MKGYVTPTRLARVIDLPISFPQTELRRGKFVHAAQFTLLADQTLHLRSMTLHVIKNLTPGLLPLLNTTGLGSISAGLYFGSTLTSPLALVCSDTVGARCTNTYHATKCASQGVYTVFVSNNTSNMDFSVAVTGAIKIYL